MSNETTTPLEQLSEYLESVAEWAIEYETAHDDIAGNYAELLRDDIDAYNKLVELLGFEPNGTYGLRNAIDLLEAKQSCTMCGQSDNAVQSYLVGEIETQIEISTICTELDIEESECRSLLKQLESEFCIRVSDSSDCFEMYNNTDNVWEFVLTAEAKTDCIIEYLTN